MRRALITIAALALVPALAVAQDTTGRQGQQGQTTTATQQDTTHAAAAAKTKSTTKKHSSKHHRKAGGAATTSDSAKANQTKSGVTNTKTGKSTLGPNVKKTRPDQGAAVTSKGDTIRRGGDTTGKAPPHR